MEEPVKSAVTETENQSQPKESLFHRTVRERLEKEAQLEREVKAVLSESPPPEVRNKLLKDEELRFSNYQACSLFFKDHGLLKLSEEQRESFIDDMIQEFSNESVESYVRPRGKDPGETKNPGEHYVVKHFGTQKQLVDAAVRFAEKSKEVLEKYNLEGGLYDYMQIAIGKTPTHEIVYDKEGKSISERPNNEIDLIHGAVAAKGQYLKENSEIFENEFTQGILLPIFVFGDEEIGQEAIVRFDDKTDRHLEGVILTSDRLKTADSAYDESVRDYSNDDLVKLDIAFDEPFSTSELYPLLSNEQKQKLIQEKRVTISLGKRSAISYDVTGSTRIAQIAHQNIQIEEGMNAFYEELQNTVHQTWNEQQIVVAQSAGDGQLGISKDELKNDSDEDYIKCARSLLSISRNFNEILYDNKSTNPKVNEFINYLKENDIPLPYIKTTGLVSDVELKLIPSAQTLVTYIKNENEPVDLEVYLKAVRNLSEQVLSESGSPTALAHIDETIFNNLNALTTEDLKENGLLLLTIDGNHFVMDISDTNDNK